MIKLSGGRYATKGPAAKRDALYAVVPFLASASSSPPKLEQFQAVAHPPVLERTNPSHDELIELRAVTRQNVVEPLTGGSTTFAQHERVGCTCSASAFASPAAASHRQACT
jgi:hypothetical protein